MLVLILIEFTEENLGKNVQNDNKKNPLEKCACIWQIQHLKNPYVHLSHYSDAIWASWHLKSQASRPFVHRLVLVNNNNIRPLHHWSFVRGILLLSLFPSQNTRNIAISQTSLPQILSIATLTSNESLRLEIVTGYQDSSPSISCQ